MDDQTVAAWVALTQTCQPSQVTRKEGFYWLRTIAGYGRDGQPVHEWTVGEWIEAGFLKGAGWSALDRHNDITYSDADFDLIGPMLTAPDDLPQSANTGI